MTHYTRHATTLFDKYRQMDSAALHADWLQHLPERPGLACDIGAGSGRDANWLAEQGWEVIAVEPEAGFRILSNLLAPGGVLVEWRMGVRGSGFGFNGYWFLSLVTIEFVLKSLH